MSLLVDRFQRQFSGCRGRNDISRISKPRSKIHLNLKYQLLQVFISFVNVIEVQISN